MGTNSKHTAKELNNSVSSTPVKPSTKQMRMQNDGESDIMKILSEINAKLNKLDNIEKHLARVNDEIKELKESFTFANDTTDDIKDEQNKQCASIKRVEESIAKIEARNADLQKGAHLPITKLCFLEGEKNSYSRVRVLCSNELLTSVVH